VWVGSHQYAVGSKEHDYHTSRAAVHEKLKAGYEELLNLKEDFKSLGKLMLTKASHEIDAGLGLARGTLKTAFSASLKSKPKKVIKPAVAKSPTSRATHKPKSDAMSAGLEPEKMDRKDFAKRLQASGNRLDKVR
jgi:hypothetical protein